MECEAEQEQRMVVTGCSAESSLGDEVAALSAQAHPMAQTQVDAAAKIGHGMAEARIRRCRELSIDHCVFLTIDHQAAAGRAIERNSGSRGNLETQAGSEIRRGPVEAPSGSTWKGCGLVRSERNRHLHVEVAGRRRIKLLRPARLKRHSD